MFRNARIAILAGALSAAAGTTALAQQPAPRTPPPLVIESMAGMDLFRFYCSACHGVDGKGHGPTAVALTTPPADLTKIAARNGGLFPRQQIVGFVSYGNPTVIVAHGSRDMPVWGPIFTGLDPSALRTQMRIENLVQYIESIQTK
jgi:mono/diheme cytochrome c family protein